MCHFPVAIDIFDTFNGGHWVTVDVLGCRPVATGLAFIDQALQPECGVDLQPANAFGQLRGDHFVRSLLAKKTVPRPYPFPRCSLVTGAFSAGTKLPLSLRLSNCSPTEGHGTPGNSTLSLDLHFHTGA